MAVKGTSETVDGSVAMLENRGLEMKVTVVVDESVTMLEDGRLELVVVDVAVAMLEGGGLGLEVTGGLLGIVRWVGGPAVDVVFRAGHAKGPASRRTGQ